MTPNRWLPVLAFALLCVVVWGWRVLAAAERQSAVYAARLDSAVVTREAADARADSVARTTATALAARDSVIARERQASRAALAASVPVVADAERALRDTAATADTLRSTIRALLLTTDELAQRLAAHLTSDSVLTARTDSVWTARVVAEQAVSTALRGEVKAWSDRWAQRPKPPSKLAVWAERAGWLGLVYLVARE